MKTIQEKGYTILELMIVIAVSASMFGIVATTFGGRQQQVQFTQAVRDFDSRLKDIKNDVSVGYYPANNNFSCRVTDPNNPEPSIVSGTNNADELGSNNDCISIGKVIQFSAPSSNYSADNNQIMKIFNVVGVRTDETGSNPTNIPLAVPRGAPGPDEALLEWGLKVKSVSYVDSATNTRRETSGIAIFSQLNRGFQLQANASNESVQISAIPSVGYNLNEAEMTGKIDNIGTNVTNGSMNFNTASEIIICVTDVEDQRKATITFGGSISGTVIDFDTYDETVCA
jgi:prepilin-type N-terminal cleavage/methylation domain-containing protein